MINIANEIKNSFGTEAEGFYFSDITICPERIHAVMINEVVPKDNNQDFYGSEGAPEYEASALALFQSAGVPVESIHDLLGKGIYITNAVKRPKEKSSVEKELIQESLPFLERELSFFPKLKVIMLMGDVAKKALNQIARQNIKKAVIPSGSTYKLRDNEFYYGDIRVIPSYIMTGGNLLIEKGKLQMISEDIAKMMEMIE
jgi:hypothetical protein